MKFWRRKQFEEATWISNWDFMSTLISTTWRSAPIWIEPRPCAAPTSNSERWKRLRTNAAKPGDCSG